MHDSFIFQQYLDTPDICDALIAYHECSSEKRPGVVGDVADVRIDKSVKDSTETSLQGALFEMYMQQLQPVVDGYIAKYPACNMYAPWGVVAPPNIQKYDPNGGFFLWHTERTTSKIWDVSARHLVFMTYLNDVTDGGETEFMMQGLKVQPRKGLTLIWPVDWTHTHRGVASPTQTKYIVTGWFCYT